MSVSELKRQREELDQKIKKAEFLEGPDLIVISGSRRFKIARTKLVEFVTKEKRNVTVIREPNDILPTDADLKTFGDLKCSVCKKSGIRLWRPYSSIDMSAPLYCTTHVPNACNCFTAKNPDGTRISNCNDMSLWVPAILTHSGEEYLTYLFINGVAQKEWLQLPIE